MGGYRRHRHSIRLAKVLALGILIASQAPQLGDVSHALAVGQTLYVAIDGSDTNPGTPGQPLRTIGRAASLVPAGGTVYLRGGTYEERPTIAARGTGGSHVVFTAYPGETADVANGFVVSGSYVDLVGLSCSNPLQQEEFIIDFDGASHCVVDSLKMRTPDVVHAGGGFRFTNNASYNAIANSTLDGSGPAFGGGADHNLIRNCLWTASGAVGPSSASDAHSYNTIEGCTIHGRWKASLNEHLGRDWFMLLMGADHFTFRNNTCYGYFVGDTSIHVDWFQFFGDGGVRGDCKSLMFENNTFGSWKIDSYDGGHDPANAIIMVSTERPCTGPWVIRNNVFVTHGNIVSFNNLHQTRWDNFIFVNNTVYSQDNKASNNQVFPNLNLVTGSGWVFENNIFAGCEPDYGFGPSHTADYNMYCCGYPKPRWEGAHSFRSGQLADDLFVNPDTSASAEYGTFGDYHLRSGAAAINAGMGDKYSPIGDRGGSARIDPPDLGAFESPVRISTHVRPVSISSSSIRSGRYVRLAVTEVGPRPSSVRLQTYRRVGKRYRRVRTHKMLLAAGGSRVRSYRVRIKIRTRGRWRFVAFIRDYNGVTRGRNSRTLRVR